MGGKSRGNPYHPETPARVPRAPESPTRIPPASGQGSGPSGGFCEQWARPCLHWPVFHRHGFFCRLSDTPHPRPSKPHGGRLYLCLFWSIEQFISLFNIFEFLGIVFPPLDIVWAPANLETHAVCLWLREESGSWRLNTC